MPGPAPAGPPNPYQAWVFAVCLGAGVAVLGRAATPTLLDDVAGAAASTAWAVLLAAGAGLGLAGAYWPGDGWTGAYLQRAGVLALAGPLLAYGVAAFSTGRTGAVLGITTAGLAAASLTRAAQITLGIAAGRAGLRAAARGPT